MSKPGALGAINDYIAPVLLSLIFLSEAIGKFWIVVNKEPVLVSRSIKLIAGTYMFFMILRAVSKRVLMVLLLLLLSFIIGQLFIPEGFSENSILIFLRYGFLLLLFYFFDIYKPGKAQSRIFFKIYEWILILNALLILSGLLFDIKIFETYGYGRFGYNGMFISSATSTYVYISALFYLAYRYRQNKRVDAVFLAVVISSVLIGTKSVYLCLIVIIMAGLFWQKRLSKSLVRLMIISAALTVIVVGYLVFFEWGIFNTVREERGILSAVLSMRNELFLQQSVPYIDKNWSLPNYFFGGVSDFSVRSQMGFIDLFLFWGIIGALVYVWSFYKAFFNFRMDRYAKLFLVFMVVIIGLAGNFFFYTTVSIFLLALKLKAIDFQEMTTQQKL